MRGFTALLQTCSCPLLALGCLREGEMVLALAGFSAHEGHPSFGAPLQIAAN